MTKRDDFIRILADEGFESILTVEREANGYLDEHRYPFEAKALALKRKIRLRIGDSENNYQIGDVFHLPTNVAHSEFYGPIGVRHL